MPIIMPRTGPVAAPEIPQQLRDKLWERIVQNYAETHREIFAGPIPGEQIPTGEENH